MSAFASVPLYMEACINLLIFGELGAVRLCSGQSLLQFEARQACVFPCESYCARLKRQVTLRLRSEGLTAAFHNFHVKIGYSVRAL